MRQNASAACIINCAFNVISTFFPSKISILPRQLRMKLFAKKLFASAYKSVFVSVWALLMTVPVVLLFGIILPRESSSLSAHWLWCMRPTRPRRGNRKENYSRACLIKLWHQNRFVCKHKTFHKRTTCGAKALLWKRESFCVCWERDAEWMARRMRWGIARAPTFIYVNTHPAQRPRLTRRPTVSVVSARE